MSNVNLAFGMPGPMEWVIIAVIVLIFGYKAIPKLARSIGQAKGEFQKGIQDGKKQDEEAGDQKLEDKSGEDK